MLAMAAAGSRNDVNTCGATFASLIEIALGRSWAVLSTESLSTLPTSARAMEICVECA